MSRTNTFMALYACDAKGCEVSVLALCTTLPETADPPVVGVPDGWVTYRQRHACSVACFAALCDAEVAPLPPQVCPSPLEGL